MSTFILELPLKTQPFQENILNKRFNIARTIYNALLNVSQKRYKEMIKTKEYRVLIERLRELSSAKRKATPEYKAIAKKLDELRKRFGITEHAFQKDGVPMQHHFKKHIDADTCQKIASRLWRAYEDVLFGNGEEFSFKKHDNLNSLECKKNSAGIRYRNGIIKWNGLEIPAEIDPKDIHARQSLEHDIAFCRIVRRFVKNKYRFYVQLVLKGKPPVKVNPQTGELKHYRGVGDVGLDIGTSTIAISAENVVHIFELADRVQDIANDLRLIERKMDRSRRATNPDNYNSDGTIKKQGAKKIHWVKSNHYKKLQAQYKELHRKQAAVRKQQHEKLANYILSLGDKVYVEDMQFQALSKKAKKTEKNDQGNFKRKKRFGKSIGNRAPALLLNIIDRKLAYDDKQLIKINTQKAKASQYDHADETYKKKPLSKRWTTVNGQKLQRDMYSAFLIMNVNPDWETFNARKCNDRFETFLQLHNAEVERLTGKKNLSSIGI